MAVASRAFEAMIAEQQALMAEAFRSGFKAGRDYVLWAERSADETTRPDTRNPYDGRDETDPDADPAEAGHQ